MVSFLVEITTSAANRTENPTFLFSSLTRLVGIHLMVLCPMT